MREIQVKNPYSYGPLVEDPAMFFGREAEMSTLFTHLHNEQSVSVVGMHRVGKSSLLYQLTHRLSSFRGQRLVPACIDLQDAPYRTVSGFVEGTLRILDAKTGGALSLQGATDLAGFSEALGRMAQVGMHPVLCMDEFEEFIQHREEFNSDFLEALRSLAARRRLVLVVASRTPLTDLVEAGGWTSPFYNIFAQVELGLLDFDAAQALRRVPFEREGFALFSEDEALVEELAGRHPFFLQMACHHLFEALSEPQDARAGIVRGRFDHDAELHFDQLWDHLHASERAALKVIIGQAVPTSEIETALKRLARLGVVEEMEGEWQPFSRAFAECVQRYPIPEGRRPSPTEEGMQRSPVRFILFAGVAVAVMLVAALISRTVSVQQFLIMFIIATIILVFALVGSGALTGQEFLNWLRDILEWLRDMVRLS